MGTFNKVDFIRDEIKELPGIDEKPSGGIGAFASRVGYAPSLCLKEKEILALALLQWAAVGIAYPLWVQMLDWIPESVWRSAAESDEGSIVDIILLAWSFVCVGAGCIPLVAYRRVWALLISCIDRDENPPSRLACSWCCPRVGRCGRFIGSDG